MPRKRPGFDDWGLIVATAVATRGDCSRKQVGAVILDPLHRVVSTGYNGSPPGGPSCLAGECPRAAAGVEPGSSYDTGPGTCIALHAEQNAIIWADPARLPGATLYVTCEPCQGCARMISGSGITRTVWGAPRWRPSRAEAICIRHKTGWCPVCGAPILDSGYSDDPELWEHAFAGCQAAST